MVVRTPKKHSCKRKVVVADVNNRELKHARFLRRGQQPEESISRARAVVSPRFLYYLSLMEKRYVNVV